jgi:hypothetical protein
MSELVAWLAGVALYIATIFFGLFLFLGMLMAVTWTINLDARAPAVQVTTVLTMALFAMWAMKRLLRIVASRSLR